MIRRFEVKRASSLTNEMIPLDNKICLAIAPRTERFYPKRRICQKQMSATFSNAFPQRVSICAKPSSIGLPRKKVIKSRPSAGLLWGTPFIAAWNAE